MTEETKSRFGMGTILGLGCGGLVLIAIVFGVIGVMMYFSASNEEVSLRNQITAQQKVNEVSFDNTWKIIAQKAEITDNYKESFRQIYTDLMAGRHYEAGGQFMKWITEKNPKFDVSLYKDLMNTVSGERKTFERNQAKILDLQRQHTDLLTKAPSSWFVGSRPRIDVKIVTSSKTEKTFETGKDDDIQVMPKKAPPVIEKKEPVEKK